MSRKHTRPGAQTHDSAPVRFQVDETNRAINGAVHRTAHTPRILVVDDAPGMRAVAAIILRSAGYEVETAGGGREAMAKIEHARPDLVLLDLNMPEVDGFEVLEALRGDALRPQMPVVIFSAVDDIESRLRAAQLGAAGFVTKRAAEAFVLRREVDQHVADGGTAIPHASHAEGQYCLERD